MVTQLSEKPKLTKSIITDKGFCLKFSTQGSVQIISADSNLIDQLMIICSTYLEIHWCAMDVGYQAPRKL